MKKKSDQNELQKKWAKVIAKAWTDESFKEKLLKNPEKVLKEMGIEFPKGARVEMHEQKGKVVHLILPERPKGEVSEEHLRYIAAGRVRAFCETSCLHESTGAGSAMSGVWDQP